MTRREFYADWLRRAFAKPWRAMEVIAMLAAIAFGVVTLIWPQWAGPVSHLMWAVPLAVFLATFVVLWLLAPYAMHLEQTKQIVEMQSREEKRARLARIRAIVINARDDADAILTTVTGFPMGDTEVGRLLPLITRVRAELRGTEWEPMFSDESLELQHQLYENTTISRFVERLKYVRDDIRGRLSNM